MRITESKYHARYSFQNCDGHGVFSSTLRLKGNQTHKTMFSRNNGRKDDSMAFFNSAVGVLQTLVIALDAGLGI